MGIPLKVQLTIDSSNYGCLMRLLEDGTIAKMIVVGQEAHPDPREFAKIAREEQPSRRHKNGGKSGFRAVEYIVAIMQRKPSAPWLKSEIAKILSAEFDYDVNSAAPALSHLIKHDFVERDDNGFISLTDKGRSHSQSDMLPFMTYYSNGQ